MEMGAGCCSTLERFYVVYIGVVCGRKVWAIVGQVIGRGVCVGRIGRDFLVFPELFRHISYFGWSNFLRFIKYEKPRQN